MGCLHQARRVQAVPSGRECEAGAQLQLVVVVLGGRDLVRVRDRVRVRVRVRVRAKVRGRVRLILALTLIPTLSLTLS